MFYFLQKYVILLLFHSARRVVLIFLVNISTEMLYVCKCEFACAHVCGWLDNGIFNVLRITDEQLNFTKITFNY